MFSKANFRAAIAKRGLSQQQVCEIIGMPLSRLTSRINGHTEWLRNEIYTLISKLQFTVDEVYDIFFNSKVY